VNDYKEIKKELSDLRSELIQYINTQETEQDLMDKFIKVKEKDEYVYELVLLIYQELKTTNKMNKKKLTSIIDNVIGMKIRTIDKLIEEKIEEGNKKVTVTSEKKDVVDKIIDMITFKNIIKGVFVWMFIFLFLFTMYNVNSDAFNASQNSIVGTVNAVNPKEKGDNK
jgi:hypothetical protein